MNNDKDDGKKMTRGRVTPTPNEDVSRRQNTSDAPNSPRKTPKQSSAAVILSEGNAYQG